MRLDSGAIERERLLRGWMRRELAQHAGVSIGSVQRACRDGNCGLLAGRKIASALGLPWRDVVVVDPPGTADHPQNLGSSPGAAA